MGEDDRKSLDKIKAALLSAFRRTPQLAMAAFQTRSLQHGESVEEFAYHLRRLLSDVMPDSLECHAGASICRRAAGNFPSKDSETSENVTLETAIRAAKRLLALQEPAPVAPIAPAHYQEIVTALAKQMVVTASLTQQMEAMTRKLDNLSLNAANTQGPRSPRRFLGNFWNCGERGHVSARCPQLYGNGSNSSPASSSFGNKSTTAYLEADTHPTSNTRQRDPRETVAYVDAMINGKNSRCLVDTGAGVSLIPPTLEGLSITNTNPVQLQVANGAMLCTQGTADLQVSIGGTEVTHQFHVADITTGVVLVADFLRRNNIDVLFSQQLLIWDTDTHQFSVPV